MANLVPNGIETLIGELENFLIQHLVLPSKLNVVDIFERRPVQELFLILVSTLECIVLDCACNDEAREA